MALGNIVRLIKSSMTLIWMDKGSRYPLSAHDVQSFATSGTYDALKKHLQLQTDRETTEPDQTVPGLSGEPVHRSFLEKD